MEPFFPLGDWRWLVIAASGLLMAASPTLYEYWVTWRKSAEARDREQHQLIWLRMDFLQTQLDILKSLKVDREESREQKSKK